MDELGELGIEFISAREAIDTSGPMGRMFITLVGSIADLERSLILERIKAGMRRARVEGQRLGRTPLDIDDDALVRDRLTGVSLTSVQKVRSQPRQCKAHDWFKNEGTKKSGCGGGDLNRK